MTYPLSKRIQAANLSREGFGISQIARKLKVSKSTINDWRRIKELGFCSKPNSKQNFAEYPFSDCRLFIYTETESGFARVKLLNPKTGHSFFTTYNRYIACVKEGRILDKSEKVFFKDNCLIIKKTGSDDKKIYL